MQVMERGNLRTRVAVSMLHRAARCILSVKAAQMLMQAVNTAEDMEEGQK